MQSRSRSEAPASHGAPAKHEESSGQQKERPLLSPDSPLFRDVQVSLSASLGNATLSMADLLALTAGSIVKLDLKILDLVELRLNESLVARGEIVAVGDNFGIRIVEIAKPT